MPAAVRTSGGPLAGGGRETLGAIWLGALGKALACRSRWPGRRVPHPHNKNAAYFDGFRFDPALDCFDFFDFPRIQTQEKSASRLHFQQF